LRASSKDIRLHRRGEMKNGNLFRLAGLALLMVCGAMLVRPAPLSAKTLAFMKMTGVVGEATDKDHKDWIMIESFSWGVARTSSVPGGAGARVAMNDLTITKEVDRSSPILAEHCAKGSNFSEVTLETKRVGGEPGYEIYVMKNVKIVSITPVPGGKMERLKIAYQRRQKIQN
jgi:type VI secretion system secreted protein Hcp